MGNTDSIGLDSREPDDGDNIRANLLLSKNTIVTMTVPVVAQIADFGYQDQKAITIEKTRIFSEIINKLRSENNNSTVVAFMDVFTQQYSSNAPFDVEVTFSTRCRNALDVKLHNITGTIPIKGGVKGYQSKSEEHAVYFGTGVVQGLHSPLFAGLENDPSLQLLEGEFISKFSLDSQLCIPNDTEWVKLFTDDFALTIYARFKHNFATWVQNTEEDKNLDFNIYKMKGVEHCNFREIRRKTFDSFRSYLAEMYFSKILYINLEDAVMYFNAIKLTRSDIKNALKQTYVVKMNVSITFVVVPSLRT